MAEAGARDFDAKRLIPEIELAIFYRLPTEPPLRHAPVVVASVKYLKH